jgi:tRNA modification GTPase
MVPPTPRKEKGAEQRTLHNDDGNSIVAIITPPGVGGIAGIRLAGRHSLSIFENHFTPVSKDASWTPFLLRLGKFADRKGVIIDEVTAVFMPEGKSYTGENQVEIFCHGSRHIATRILDAIVASGARVAEPGEFTKMAFLSGRVDLAEAEAVSEMVSANTETSLRAAREHLLGAYSEHVNGIRERLIDVMAEVEAGVDYPEEGISPAESNRLIVLIDNVLDDLKRLLATYSGGRIIREGFRIAIAGRPNAGKSSLFNLLVRHERALVTSTPGTTRDYITEWIDIGGLAVCLVDTAGIRTTGGKIEKIGQAKAKEIMAGVDLVLWLTDLSSKNWKAALESDLKKIPKVETIVVGNKTDKAKPNNTLTSHSNQVLLSCKTESGMPALIEQIEKTIKAKIPDLTAGLVVTSARHKAKLLVATRSLKTARENIARRASPEITAVDLRDAVNAIDEITGRIYTEEILGRIFSKFCIGK